MPHHCSELTIWESECASEPYIVLLDDPKTQFYTSLNLLFIKIKGESAAWQGFTLLDVIRWNARGYNSIVFNQLIIVSKSVEFDEKIYEIESITSSRILLTLSMLSFLVNFEKSISSVTCFIKTFTLLLISGSVIVPSSIILSSIAITP